MLSDKIQNKVINLSRKLKNLPNARSKHFTFILLRNKILSIGYNNVYKTTPLAFKFGHWNNCIHSEIDAYNRFQYSDAIFRTCKIINVRLNKSNEIKISKPCKRCQKFLKYKRLEEIFYTDDSGIFECFKLK